MRAAWIAIGAVACASHAAPPPPALHRGPIVIDRFSAHAGHLMVRDAKNRLPAPGAPIDFTRAPFLTQGLGPDGSIVRYVNLDVQPDAPAILYRRAGAPDEVRVIPGDDGYSDFWRIANVGADGSITMTRDVIDCAIVPRGTHAPSAEAHEVVYGGERLTCLLFGSPLALDGDRVPTSPIFVTFAHEKVFKTEARAPVQTHNVVMSLPGDLDYSPLWAVHVYDPSEFDRVHDAESAARAKLVEPNGPHVNCPIVSIEPH